MAFKAIILFFIYIKFNRAFIDTLFRKNNKIELIKFIFIFANLIDVSIFFSNRQYDLFILLSPQNKSNFKHILYTDMNVDLYNRNKQCRISSKLNFHRKNFLDNLKCTIKIKKNNFQKYFIWLNN
jgi:hypothetical protein